MTWHTITQLTLISCVHQYIVELSIRVYVVSNVSDNVNILATQSYNIPKLFIPPMNKGADEDHA